MGSFSHFESSNEAVPESKTLVVPWVYIASQPMVSFFVDGYLKLASKYQFGRLGVVLYQVDHGTTTVYIYAKILIELLFSALTMHQKNHYTDFEDQ